jgi:hypothetical protein
MNPQHFLAAAHACAAEMMRNAGYILREIEGMELPADIRSGIRELCSEWIGTRFDVFSEIDEVHELRSRTDSTDRIGRKLAMIQRWLNESAMKSGPCVERLRTAADAGRIDRMIVTLVAESAANVFNLTPQPPVSAEDSLRCPQPSSIELRAPICQEAKEVLVSSVEAQAVLVESNDHLEFADGGLRIEFAGRLPWL